MSSSNDYPLSSFNSNLSSISNKSRLAIGSATKLKIPTPVSSFKRPGPLQTQGNEMKRSRFDLSSDADARKKIRSNLRRSKSLVSVRDPGRNPLSASENQSSIVKREAAASSRANAICRAPSLSSVASTRTKPSATVTAPTTKSGKRPAWDIKGRMEDKEEILREMRKQNAQLHDMLQTFNQRRTSLEEQNMKLGDETRAKEAVLLEVSNEAETLRSELSEKVKACALYESEKKGFQHEIATLTSELKNSQLTCADLQSTIASMVASQAATNTVLAASKVEQTRLNETVVFLEGKAKQRDEEIENLKLLLQEKENKIREDENTRRYLHNTIQELKGNIRVFCRVRPLLKNENMCQMTFPDSDNHSLELTKKDDHTDPMKNRNNNKFTFTFDHVFDSSKTQKVVFDEISQLIQSVLDGYNVCVFAYGQTGSGKTFTMEGSVDSGEETFGMIPRTVTQIFESIKSLECRGWTYEMTASFLEIYNETIRDLLGNPNDENVKHEIRMADPKGSDVYVTNIAIVNISSEEQVFCLLRRAQKNRAVGATKCNERSSRSHSVFQLNLKGKNIHTTETCQGVLNLVDLAGSERLKESQSQGERLKETKSINKSLSNLSNVIMCLAQKAEYIPFRSSKLTHLLMNSLGGNSKTLMFVNVSPSEESFNETLNSLRFATKVNECNIGSAQKKTVK